MTNKIDKEYIDSLPKFNKNKNCDKCGSHNAGSTWIDHENGDYLERTCSMCGYIWNEKTKDRT